MKVIETTAGSRTARPVKKFARHPPRKVFFTWRV